MAFLFAGANMAIEYPKPIAVTPVPNVRYREFTKCGQKPLAGGKIWTYEANSTTPKVTYKDPYGITPNTNPIILDAAGEADIYLNGTYRFVVEDKTGVIQKDVAKIGSWYSGDLADQFKSFNDALETSAQQLMQPLQDAIDTALAAGAGDAGWTTSLVVYEGVTQKEVNDGIDTIAKLSNIKATNGARFFVKNFNNPNLALSKPYFGGGGGGFVFEEGSIDPVDNVYTFTGLNGRWKRVNWQKPTIYDAGIYDETLDNTIAFKALLNISAKLFWGKKEIDLDNRTLKITDFVMYSNMTIKNGGLDFRGSSVINLSNFAFAGLIIGENAPYRDLDPQIYTRYAELPAISNFGFDNVEFISPDATNNIRRNVMAFYKWQGFKMLRCKFNLNGARAYKLVGSFNNTNYTGLGLWDQPEPYGGYSSKAKIKFNEFIGIGYSQNSLGKNILSDTGQFAAAEDIEFSFNKSKDLMIGCHFDAYTRNSSCHHNSYEIQDSMLDAFTNASTADVVGVYVGQCGYGNSIYKNRVQNAIRHSIYAEASSDIDIKNNKITHSSELVSKSPSIAHAITIQANSITDSTSSTTFNKGCEDIEISGNTIKSLRQGVVVSSAIADSARAINIHDNNISVSDALSAILITNILDSAIQSNTCKGNIQIGKALSCRIEDNSFKNTSNYALYLTSALKTGTTLKGNKFYCDSGAVIYNGTAKAETLEIYGGVIKQNAGTTSMQNNENAGKLFCYNFSNGIAAKKNLSSQVILLNSGGRVVINIPYPGVRAGWLVRAYLQNLANLWSSNSIDLTLKAESRKDSVDILIQNDGSSSISSSFNIVIEVDAYIDNSFTN